MIYAVHKFSKRHRIVEPDAKGKYRASMDERLVQATPDGWIEWQGGECPLPDGAKYDAKLYSGKVVPNCEVGINLTWDCVFAYRPILDDDTKVSHPGTMAGPDKYRASGGEWPEPPAWDGSGLPPVGWSGEYKPCWHACEVVAYHKGFAVVWDAHDLEYFRTKDPAIFRPIRSKEERVVEEMMEVDEVGFTTRDKAVVLDFARALYRAGYRKTDAADGEEV